jgi:hypothetical protein
MPVSNVKISHLLMHLIVIQLFTHFYIHNFIAQQKKIQFHFFLIILVFL